MKVLNVFCIVILVGKKNRVSLQVMSRLDTCIKIKISHYSVYSSIFGHFYVQLVVVHCRHCWLVHYVQLVVGPVGTVGWYIMSLLLDRRLDDRERFL